MGGGTQNCGFHSRHSRVITYWVGCWGIRTAGLWGCSAKVGWGSVLRQEKWCHGRRDWPGKIYIWFEYDFCDTWAFKHLVQIYWEVVFPEFLRGFSRYRGFTSLPISEHFHFFPPHFWRSNDLHIVLQSCCGQEFLSNLPVHVLGTGKGVLGATLSIHYQHYPINSDIIIHYWSYIQL